MRCKSCPTDIRWIKHAKTGKPAPIETSSDTVGNIRVGDIGTGGTRYVILTGEHLEAAREAGEPLYLNHFATCPGAESYR